MLYDNRVSVPLGASQRGAVLIIGLIMLLLMTIVGLAAIRGSGLQEMMAGNMRERTLAFQAAEAGLREGEEYSEAVSSEDFNGSVTGLYQDLNQPGEESIERRPESFWVEDNARSSGLSLDTIEQPPLFTIERIELLNTNCLTLDDCRNQPVLVFYRVTSRGVTDSGTTDAVVQSMVRPRL